VPLYPDFERLYQPFAEVEEPVRWLPMRGRDLIVQETDSVCSLLTSIEEGFTPHEPLVLGRQDGVAYLACDAPAEQELPAGWRAIDLWRLHGRIPEQDWMIAGYGAHILHWRRTSAHCPVCGHAMGPMGPEWMRQCPQCGHQRYPQISPAVLILVHDGADRILLSHQPGWGEMYSILAGFVLPGESLEECVQREVEEEVNLHVTDLVYAGSQPWPFPQQLMIGFTARYSHGEIRIDEQELDRAAWFAAGELPPLPPPLSLSRRMIDAWRLSRLAPP
jgi:NAD+ diphosphatase